jgi:Icc-related predicted phosphoesterase
MYRITAISDTHTLHRKLTDNLPGGDVLIHAGDFTSMGYLEEIQRFCDWFEDRDEYLHKIYIAGNHELGVEDHPEETKELIDSYAEDLVYLQDDLYCLGEEYDEMVKIWGSPWQPEFCNWAFNLPRNGEELEEKWAMIPQDTDILITHGPPFDILDKTPFSNFLGCEKLKERIEEVRPQIHIFGHIHHSYGYYFDGLTHFINASVLNEQYKYANKPVTFDWDEKTNKIDFL